MQEIHKQEMKEHLQHYLPYLSEKKVIIFGHCNAGEELCAYLQEKGITPFCFLDNNQEKQGGYHGRIPIFPPTFMEECNKEDSIVLIITRYFHEMASQLRGFGYEGEIVEVVEFQSFQGFSTDLSLFQKKCERVREGGKTLKGIQTEFPSDFLVLCPYRALGDVYWAMSYLPSYLKKQGILSCCVAVVGKACAQVVSLFGYEHTVVLEQKEMDALVQGVVFTHEEQAIVVHHGPLYFDLSLSVLHQKFIGFTDYYRDVVYGLSPEAEAVPPLHQKTISAGWKAEIDQGNAVIIAPYAHSVVGVPSGFWETLVLDYKGKGFSVFTNVAPGELPLNGTKALSLSLAEMKSAVEWAGYFVGLRSGLCDVLQSASCQKTLVFASTYFGGTKHKLVDFFSLDGWETLEVDV